MQRILTVFACVVLALAAACAPDEEAQFKAAFKAKYEKPLCLSLPQKYPFVAATWDQDWADALVDAGIFSAKAVDSKILAVAGAKSYVLTDKGRARRDKNGALCYGAVRVVKIIDYTDPVTLPAVGRTIRVQALLRYDVTESWAKDKRFGPRIKTGTAPVQDILLHKQKSGWQMLLN